jgi:RNA polymerase sigma-70 factor (TIGR02960 family)
VPSEPAGGRPGAHAEFAALTAPFRSELVAHCYRLLGSIHDAEDLVQETYVRAWRGYAQFEGRSSLRRWLYTIATRTCLTALTDRPRRALPSGLGGPADDHRVAVPSREPAMAWLEPAPDSLLGGDPATIVGGRAGVRLAFIAALQFLPARQRAVLTLRDVLAFRTAEVAGILGTSTAAVDSTLRRARARLADLAPAADDLAEPDDQFQRDLLDRYVDAFTRADTGALITLLRADVELEMPPISLWFTGQAAVTGFLARRVLRPGRWQMIPARANTQPAVVAYRDTGAGRSEPYGVQVLTLIGPRIARITSFNDPDLATLFSPAPGPAVPPGRATLRRA